MSDQPLSLTMSRRCFLLTLVGAGDRTSCPVPAPRPTGRVRIEIRGRCRACGACARACPTQALRFCIDELDYRLLFRPELCTDCGLCRKVCLAGCLARISGGAPPRAETPVILACTAPGFLDTGLR